MYDSKKLIIQLQWSYTYISTREYYYSYDPVPVGRGEGGRGEAGVPDVEILALLQHHAGLAEEVRLVHRLHLLRIVGVVAAYQ